MINASLYLDYNTFISNCIFYCIKTEININWVDIWIIAEHYQSFYKVPVGIDDKLKNNHQIVLLERDYKIVDELLLYNQIEFYTCHCTRLNAYHYLQK